MKFPAIEEFLYRVWGDSLDKASPPTTFLILGPPGVGKSTVASAVIQRMQKSRPDADFLCEIIDLTSRLPEDLGGLPFRCGERTQYCPQDWMARLSAPGAQGILVLDDLPAASSAIAAATRQIALSRSINGVTLSPGILVIVTGNRSKDKAGAATLPSHFRNAVCILEMEPDFKTWCSWFLRQGGNKDICSFLQWKPDAFSQQPSEADGKGSFATPRTWTMLNSCMNIPNGDSVQEIASGFVGEGVSLEFSTFLRSVAELPPAEDMLYHPQQAMPHPEKVLNQPDKMIGAVRGVATIAAQQNAPEKFLYALQWLTGHNREYVAAGLDAYAVAGGTADAIHLASVTLRKKDPKIDEMLSYLKQNVT